VYGDEQHARSMSSGPEHAPKCDCGGPLKVHVGIGRFGGILVWASCASCGRVIAPYGGPLTLEAADEIASLKGTESA
jgi:hypothetical protein